MKKARSRVSRVTPEVRRSRPVAKEQGPLGPVLQVLGLRPVVVDAGGDIGAADP